MLATVKMLNIELLTQKGMNAKEDILPMITVQTPAIYERQVPANVVVPEEIPVMEKQIQVLQIDEAAVEAELDAMALAPTPSVRVHLANSGVIGV